MIPSILQFATGCAQPNDNGDENTGSVDNTPNRGRYSLSVTEADSIEELHELISDTVEPGDYAVVTMAATWCGPCYELEGFLHTLAASDQGRHPYFHTWNGDQADFLETLEDRQDPEWGNISRESCARNIAGVFPTTLAMTVDEDGQISEIHDIDIYSAFFYNTETGDFGYINETRSSNELYQVEDGNHDGD
ncbi:MAG: hypothetical protein H7A33_04545 [Deltaproteobacteria bacterium]|nr:hypothetical protein [Deltaproteobacteria bacterium]